jgi:hypothetical protein
MENKRYLRKSIRYNEDIKNKIVELYKHIKGLDDNTIVFSDISKDKEISGVIRMALDLVHNNDHLINNETNTSYSYLSDLYRENSCSYKSFICKIADGFLEVPIKIIWDYGNIFISRMVESNVYDYDDDYMVFKLTAMNEFNLIMDRIDNITQVALVDGTEIEYDLNNTVEDVSYIKIYLK